MREDRSDGVPALAIPAIASAGAAVLHAAAAGVHTEHQGLTRIFIALALLQVAVAIAALLGRGRAAAAALAAVNLGAVAGWVVTRLWGISWIGGLEAAERPGTADSIAAILAAVAVLGSIAALSRVPRSTPAKAVASAAVLAGVIVVPGLVDATNHSHDGGHEHADATRTDDHDDGHAHTVTGAAEGETAAPAEESTDHAHDDNAEHGHDDGVVPGDESAEHIHDDTTSTAWPRPWDPAEPIDFSGVPGVNDEQRQRAEQLVVDTLRDLPAFSDVNTIGALGYQSIGDAVTGYEHFVNYSLIFDDTILDPSEPESLVYRVDGDQRTLVSAMFIAGNTPIDDPELVDFGGPLMQWHVHENLCWGLDDNGQPKVQHVLTQPGETCPPLTINAGGENPMVHVWIVPHECGPFAALEGHGAGQVDPSTGERADQCAHDDGHADASPVAKPYDPTQPIDLSGVEGVTPEQQAFAENLVAATVRDLPQWADPDVVEAAGFHSIRDAATGHEHYIQWDWIDDDVWLDPDHPESLVFEPQPDGSKKLVSAMFMLPRSMDLEEVPDWGGALMQWHVHGDLCFTDDPVAPIVAGVKPLGGTCAPPLVDFPLSPMIHVWITPTPCGPFAALDGIAGGQVPEGEAVLCDHAHGSG